MVVPTMMTEHVDEKHEDEQIEMATWDVSRPHLYREARRWIHSYLSDVHEQQGKILVRTIRLDAERNEMT